MPNLVITGASRGIGRATAERFAAAGWGVATASRSAERRAELEQTWKRRFPDHPLLAVAADLSTPAGRQQFTTVVTQTWPPPDALVNNLGAYRPATLLTDPDYLTELLEVNLLAAYDCCRTFLPAMRKQGRGHLVTIGSIATRDLPPAAGQYTVTKYALEGMHHALTAELGNSGLRTTLVVPGATLTASWDNEPTRGKTLLAPADIAELIFAACTEAGPTWPRELLLRP